MECLEIYHCKVVALIGYEYKCYEFDHSPKVCEKLLSLACKFWQDIENNIEPDPINYQDLMTLYPDVRLKIAMESTEALEEAIMEYQKGCELEKQAKEIKDGAKFEIVNIVKDVQLVTRSGKPIMKMLGKSGSRYPKIMKGFDE